MSSSLEQKVTYWLNKARIRFMEEYQRRDYALLYADCSSAVIFICTASNVALLTFADHILCIATLPGTATTLDFESVTASLVISNANTLRGIMFNYEFKPPPMYMQVSNNRTLKCSDSTNITDVNPTMESLMYTPSHTMNCNTTPLFREVTIKSIKEKAMLKRKFIVFSLSLVIIICAFGANAAIDPPVGGKTNHAFAAFDQLDPPYENHMYHSGMDYAVFFADVVAGVSGEVRHIFGLDANGNDNDCLGGEEKVFLWDVNESESCPVDIRDRSVLTNCIAQCTGRTGTNNSKFGISVIVAHQDAEGEDTGHYSLYAHLSQVRKELWDAYDCFIIDASTDCGELSLKVKKDDFIGRSGGSSRNKLDGWPYHLHYEVRKFDSLLAPGPYFSYTPDLPMGYGYEDPRTYYYEFPDSVTLVGGLVLNIGNENLRIRSGPGKKYSVLGWTGTNQLLVADRKATSTTGDAGGDKDVETGRTWYRVRLPSRVDWHSVHGWIAATADDGSNNVVEQTVEPIYSVVNAASGKGWPLILDYSETSEKPSEDCIERVSVITNNNCVRVWDDTQNNHYLAVKVWNGFPLAIVPKEGVSEEDKYDPIIGPGDRQWYQVYIPAIHFKDPAKDCPNYTNDDQCVGNILTAWLPSDALSLTVGGRGMDFEDGTDRDPIQSTIPGLEFSTTDGDNWLYADWRAGYNGPYPNGDYFSNGNYFAWLGENQGLGRIDFVGSTAVALSLGYSSYSNVNLEACSITSNETGEMCDDGVGYLVDKDTGTGNLSTGRLDRLSVEADVMDYVLFHDSGNYWLVDDLAVVDLLGDTQGLIPYDYDYILGQMLAADWGVTNVVEFMVADQQFFEKLVKVYLNWSGSELRLEVYDANNRMVAVDQSQFPPISLTIPDGQSGTWRAEITAVDIPYDGYPVSLVVASTDLPDSDGDGVVDSSDNCSAVPNQDQLDFDGDAIGDACDNCPSITNSDQEDNNNNGVGDACEIMHVEVDIKPGSDPNCFSINGHGVIPAAVLGNADFDVSQIDLSSVAFGGLAVRVRGNKGPLCSIEYSNDDAYLDLVCHFEDDAGNWGAGDGEAMLTGELIDGTPFEGTDSICVVP